MKVKLKKPITVGEGDSAKKIEEVNLDGLENLTGADIIFCRGEAASKKGQPVIYGFLDDLYRLEVAAKASGLEPEVIKKLFAPDFEAVDSEVRSFLAGSDSE